MFLPIGTDNPLKRTPVANYAIIIINIVIFLYTYHPHTSPFGESSVLRDFAVAYELDPEQPQIYQFISYAFLHAGWMHIIGNMLFLYIFGNNVNDKLGNIGYLLLYLGGGVFSGMGHALVSSNPVLGASGAVAAVTGAYMVLFPKTYIHVLYVIFFIGSVEVPALYFILFKLVLWDNVMPVWSGAADQIAYEANLAGYAFGIGIPLFMLALKMLPHSHYDLWALIGRWRRRREYSQVVNRGFNPFGSDADNSTDRKVVQVKVTENRIDPHSEKISKLRTEISIAVNSSRLEEAAKKYLQLLAIDKEQVLPQQQQLDIANQLMHIGERTAAADSYEIFLKHYRSTYPFIEQIELMAGLIYSRYLNQVEPARRHLEAALVKLTDDGQKKMCRDELNRLNGATG